MRHIENAKHTEMEGGIYNFTPTPQRSERGRKRGRERESALKDWSLTNSLGYFDVTLTWFLSGYVFWGIWEMKFENLFILDSITPCSTLGTYWVCAVTFGCRSWCDCQKCEMRERDEKLECVSEGIRRREEETVRLIGECVGVGVWTCANVWGESPTYIQTHLLTHTQTQT